MHLFLYQAARHEKPSWGTRRLSQNTIRMDFDLALLKQGIKGRYEIVGCTLHPWQQALKKVGLEEEFYGHIIEIEDSKNAVWFKLNYDNIGRGVTKYIGGWRDLDPSHIEPHILQYQNLNKVLTELNSQTQGIRNQGYYLNSFCEPRQPHPEVFLEAQKKAIEYQSALRDATNTLNSEIKKTQKAMAKIQDAVRQYMKDHKG